VASDRSAILYAIRLERLVIGGARQAAVAAALLMALGTGQSWAVGDVPIGAAMGSVRSSFGIPNAIRFDSAGRQTWEYTGQRVPSGAYRLTFDAQGTVLETTPLRTPERLERVRAGETTGAALVELLGEPRRIAVTDAGIEWLFPRAGGKPVIVTLGADRRVKSISGMD